MSTCPFCGAEIPADGNSARNAGTVIGALAGSAMVVARILRGAPPILPATLLVGCLIGLLWGAQAGRLVGEQVQDLMPTPCCPKCGRDIPR